MAVSSSNSLLRALLCTVAALMVVLHAPDLGENPILAKPAVERDRYGIEKGRYQRQSHRLEARQTLSAILRTNGISPEQVARVSASARSVIDVRKLKAGNELLVYVDSTAGTSPLFVYRANLERFVVFDFRDSVAVFEGFLNPSVSRRQAHGSISQSLYESLDALGASGDLAAEMARVFAWQVGFYQLQEGDQFAVIYDEGRIDQTTTHIDILAARFLHRGQDYYAYGFRQEDGTVGYYDEEGNALKRQFLRAPLEYTRISSRFSRRRYHPVQKRYKPHLGTDFAAPHGTPIVATADGTVIAAGRAGGNGRYVKVRHNDIYTTAYLHMSRIAVKRGQQVKQGEVIGYVGSTGLATGPHVCYRFWERGRQVDPLQLTLPPAEPIEVTQRAAFEVQRDRYASHLAF